LVLNVINTIFLPMKGVATAGRDG